jgi:hypothetical protein
VNSFQFTRSARLILALHRNAKYAYLCATSSCPSLHRGSDAARCHIYFCVGPLKSMIIPASRFAGLRMGQLRKTPHRG